MESVRFMKERVTVTVGDLTLQQVDAIVNAANSSLLGGGGVDGAIHRAGGPAILIECRELRESDLPDGLPVGEAVVTTAGDMPAQFVIHTVGPNLNARGPDAPYDPPRLLGNCYSNALRCAVHHGCRTIAFPAISTGIFGYPPAEAAAVSSAAVGAFLQDDRQLTEVRFVFFLSSDAEIFLANQRFEDGAAK